jgi:hypothetical protein
LFEALLNADDASRAAAVLGRLAGHGVSFALAGSLAIEARLRAQGYAFSRRKLNDIDLVVADIASLPKALARRFLANHVHPLAPAGKLLLQLVDAEHRLRVDVFRAYGNTLSRAGRIDAETGSLDVLAIEDARARLIAHLCMCLRKDLVIDVKYVDAFRRLDGLGDPARLLEAWNDHRQEVPGTLSEACEQALRGISERQDLIRVEKYSVQTAPCERCQAHGGIAPANSARIAEILGYS